ncbi:hypothetical protein CHUAL_000440 [Chamberlinius hualienensis]
MEGTAATVSSLYTELARNGQNQEWQKGLKNSNRILHYRPDEFKAFHCKIVCMIHLSQFKEAVTAIEKNSKVAPDLVFEHGYCLYRQNKILEALKVLESVENDDNRIKELKAQILYRLEKYDECYELYRDVIKNSQDDNDVERSTNFAAVLAYYKSTKLSQEEITNATRGDTYELAYNRSCVLISQEKYTEAEETLVEAEDLCKKSFDDDEDVAEDDIDAELEIIRIQSGYCKQILGKKNEASQLYGHVLKQKPSDPGLLAIVSNNVVVINKDRNVFESKKRMKSATAVGLEQKLNKSQQKIISINQCLFSLYTNQNDQCRDQLQILKSQYPDCRDVALIEAALLSREKNIEAAIDLLKATINSEMEEMPRMSFVLVQLLLTQGRVRDACDVLTSLKRVYYRPGIVSALVTLFTSLLDHTAATAALESAVNWYKTSDPKNKKLVDLLKESSNFYLNQGNYVAAAKSLEELRKAAPNDPKTIAKLVTAYSKFDQNKAKSISKSLPTVQEVSKSIDVDNLETLAWSLGAKHFKKLGKAEESPGKPMSAGKGADEILLKKRKKKKKNRKLKGNVTRDPDAYVDPERWLPRRERSNFKKRKDRRGVGIGKGTQGATTGSSELDNASKVTDTPRSTGAASNASSPHQESKVQRQQPAKKKKKKGGKW